MKNPNKILVLFIAVLLAGSVKADGCGVYRVELTIEDTKGRVNKGYARAVICDLDSLNSPEYLKKALTDWEKPDSLIYFKDKICYEFANIGDSSGYKDMVCQLKRKAAIPFKSIKDIKIDSMIYVKYSYSIMNDLKWSDTVWMKKEPIRVVEAYEELVVMCHYQIFVHENSPKTDDILKQLEAKQKEYEDAKELIGKELEKLIERLKGQRVMILRECSC